MRATHWLSSFVLLAFTAGCSSRAKDATAVSSPPALPAGPIQGTAALLPLVTVPAGALAAEVPRTERHAAAVPASMVALSPTISSDRARVLGAPGVSTGRAAAPVVVHEFGDFQCPACRVVAESFTKAFLEQYVTPGRVRFVFVQFPLSELHPNATLAAEASLCANDQQRFMAYHDQLYATQDQWAPQRDPTRMFVGLATGLHLETGAFAQCLARHQHAAAVTASRGLARSLGLNGTPTFFVNGELVPTTNGQVLVDAVDAALATSTRHVPMGR
jgi:protein-disulfide isomerase